MLYDTLTCLVHGPIVTMALFEPRHEKTCLQGFQPGLTQSGCTATADGQRLEILD